MNPQRVAAAAAVLSLCGLLAGVALPALQSPRPVSRAEITTTPPESAGGPQQQPVTEQTTSTVPNAENQQPQPGHQPVEPADDHRPPPQPAQPPVGEPVDDDPGEDSDD